MSEYHEAEKLGIRWDLPNMSEVFWLKAEFRTLKSTDAFNGNTGFDDWVLRSESHSIRCVADH